jgi:glycine amidinotransferase
MTQVSPQRPPEARESNPVVCSYNEWDPLEEIIVGTARGAVRPAAAPSRPGTRSDRHPPEAIDAAERQLDGFAALLEAEGVVVRRPEPLDQARRVQTPDFAADGGRAQTCPRDVLLVVGDEIIEATMSDRARFFEYLAYRPLIREYFRQGARWTAAPKPSMADEMYVPGYEEASRPYDLATHPNLTETEPCFDAACFARMGRDIVWQPDLVSNQFGADWLQRHLGPEYRIHRIEFAQRQPIHIDATMVPLRPGLVLANPERPARHGGMDLFTSNGWQVVAPVPSARPKRKTRPWEVSEWISMNVLCLDEHTVVVEQAEEPFIDQLKGLGFDVIPCPFDAVYGFGGSFHCCTIDIRRRGTLQSYFPALDG